MRRVIGFVVCLLAVRACSAAVYTVDLEGPADFVSIQAALDQVVDGDTIVVRPGVYAEDVNFAGKNVVLSGTAPESSAVVSRTVIEGHIQFRGDEEPNCALTGFEINGTITGFASESTTHTRATISFCRLTNILTGCGSLIRGCDGTISHCVIADIGYLCRRAWPVPAIVDCRGVFENCTLANVADGIEVADGGVCTLRNCIVHRSDPFIVRGDGTVHIAHSMVDTASNIVVGDGAVTWETESLDLEPCFARLGDWEMPGDYHLRSEVGRWDPNSMSWTRDEVTSLGIDAGDAASDWSRELWPHGKRINLGAYGGTPEASLSAADFGLAADLNQDAIVDARDLHMLAQQWLDEMPLLAQDFDRDGSVNQQDFARFAPAWRAGPSADEAPLELILGRRAQWSPKHEGYDPNLPGFHVVGDIASVTLRATTDAVPETLVLIIQNLPSTQPMLENFTLTGSHIRLTTEPFNEFVELACYKKSGCAQDWQIKSEIATKEYFTFEIVGDAIHVEFQPKAIELLRTPCEISWIDWYRR